LDQLRKRIRRPCMTARMLLDIMDRLDLLLTQLARPVIIALQE